MSKLLTVSSVLLARIEAQSMNIPLPILCESQKNEKTVETQALINSGAGGDFLHEDFVDKHRIDLLPLDTPIIKHFTLPHLFCMEFFWQNSQPNFQS